MMALSGVLLREYALNGERKTAFCGIDVGRSPDSNG
jgi:hypothetical protein